MSSSNTHQRKPTTTARGRNHRATRETDDEGYVEGPGELSTSKIFIVVLASAALIVGLYIQVAKNLSESLKGPPSGIGSEPTTGDGANFKSTGGGAVQASRQHDTLVVADNMDAGYLDHIVDTLIKFGHKLSFRPSISSPKSQEDLHLYNLIWMHDYPFQSIKKLHPYQRINHFPGTGFITNKLTLSTTPRLPHVLKAFRLPHDRDKFVEFAQAKQRNAGTEEVLWIRKSSGHRGISIETVQSILDKPHRAEDGSDILIQEYMSNPLLVDGKKFDIGIYAVLTSVDPIRVYIFESEALLRFCGQSYHDSKTGKFNASNEDSYVVGDDYTPIWLMPSLLRHYIGTSLSMKQTLNTYLKRSRANQRGEQIWEQIEETIKHVYKSKEHHLARMARMYQANQDYNSTSVEGALNQFFEMVRFDFIVDDQLNVFLMEANMSPNLSSRHFPPNRLLYEQVLASYFNLVGLTQFASQHLTSSLPIHYLSGRLELPNDRVKMPSETFQSNRYGLDDLISEKDLSVYEDLCVSDECHMNCHKLDCRVCHFCLSNADKLHLRRAIFEQYSRWNFKRLLPSTRDQDLKLQMSHPDRLSRDDDDVAATSAQPSDPSVVVDANYIHVQWFRGKCLSDKRFCSYT